MVATKKPEVAKAPAKGKEDSKKLPAVPESVLKHRKRRDALRTRRVQVNIVLNSYTNNNNEIKNTAPAVQNIYLPKSEKK